MIYLTINEVICEKNKKITNLKEQYDQIMLMMNSYDHTDIDYHILETELELVHYQIKSYKKLIQTLQKTQRH